MADTVRVGARFLDALHAYADRVDTVVQEASYVSLQHLEGRMQQEAAARSEWADIADHIQVMTDQGRYVIGVPGGETGSEAEGIEYGVDDRPPSPLFRTSPYLLDESRGVANAYIEQVLGRVVL